jgi:hypothetical protein
MSLTAGKTQIDLFYSTSIKEGGIEKITFGLCYYQLLFLGSCLLKEANKISFG